LKIVLFSGSGQVFFRLGFRVPILPDAPFA